MELEGSLPYSQQPDIGHYPQPEEFNPHLPTVFLTSILLLKSHLHLGFP